jgi:hypothetical protein
MDIVARHPRQPHWARRGMRSRRRCGGELSRRAEKSRRGLTFYGHLCYPARHGGVPLPWAVISVAEVRFIRQLIYELERLRCNLCGDVFEAEIARRCGSNVHLYAVF